MKHYPVSKNKSVAWCAVALGLTVASAFAQSVISLNFDGQDGTGTPGPVTGVAGSVPADNWNNTGTGNGGNVGVGVALVDDSGAATGATVNWSVANHWTTNGVDSSGGDATMMQGYLDNFHDQPPIEITGIPASFMASGYELRIYHNTDSAGAMGFTVDDGSGPTTYYSYQPGGNGSNFPLAGADPFGGAAGYIGSQETDGGATTASNYTLFTGLSGASVTITGVRGSAGDTRSRPNGFQIVSTGPSLDEDGDGLADSWETANGLDPADDGSVDINNGPAGDPDNDGSANLEEFERRTDPQSDDTDDDGLLDGVESGTGIFVSATDTGTDPLDDDSDGDSLVDGAEASADPFVTDPNNQDTDGDGVNDGTEISSGSDPTDPTDVPGGGVIGAVISMNFDGQTGTGTPGAVTGVAGSIPVGNWNNSGQGNAFNEGPLDLVDDSGVATTATVNWSVANHWTTNGGDSSGGDATMMQGYLDNFHDRPPIVVSGIPASFMSSGYELRIYHNTDSAGAMGFTVSDDGGLTSTTYYSYQPGGNGLNFPLAGADPFGGAAGYIGSQETGGGATTASNYTLFTGLSGAELTIAGVRGSAGDTRSRPNGFQIVAIGPALDGDEDGLGDSWETANGLDPADDGSVDINNGPAGDPDNDGSVNLEEFERGTDPQNDDSDDDGLLDSVESGTGIFVSETDTGTNPRDADSDGDGLEDGAEVDTHQTDPTDADSDDDGTDDGDELQIGTNPNDPNSMPPLALPIGYWSFDDQGAGGTTADLSNGGNDGTLNGGPEVVEGPCGPGDFALKFDGIDDSVTTEVSLFTGGAEFTMSGWVKFETAQIGNRVGWFGQNDAVEFGLINPAQLQHWTNVGGALNVTVADTSPEWMHVAITGDAAGRIAYLNGVAEPTPGNSAAGASSAFPFNIGGSGIYDASGNWFTGCIDEVAVWDKALTADEIMQLATCAITPLGRPRSQVGVEITEFHRTGTGDIQISWKSRQDRQYDILSNADLSTPRLQWAEVAGAQDIQGDASGITTAVVAAPFPETGYLVVREEGLPALFEDDLESDTGWTAIVNDANGNTNWERGSPNGSTGPLTGADGSANAWCTNLADYGPDSDISLRSPAIDLTGVVGAELSFEAFRDGDGFGDVASVRFLRAADQVQLGAEISIDMTAFDADWRSQTIPVEDEAIGESVMIEFNFVSDSSPDAFSGLSIDNIVVSVP